LLSLLDVPAQSPSGNLSPESYSSQSESLDSGSDPSPSSSDSRDSSSESEHSGSDLPPVALVELESQSESLQSGPEEADSGSLGCSILDSNGESIIDLLDNYPFGNDLILFNLSVSVLQLVGSEVND
jgi:hypothetical protein